MSRVEISQAYEIQKNMMRLMGVWHEETPTRFYKIRRAVTWVVFLIAYVSMLIQVVYVIADFEELVQILYLTTSYTSYFCKILGFTYNRKTFLNMLTHLEDPVFTPCSENLMKHVIRAVNITTVITKLYRFACVTVVVLFWIYPWLENVKLPTPFPFDLGSYNPLMYFIQSFAVFVAAWNNLSLDSLCASLMALSASQFDVLKDKIIDVREHALQRLPEVEDPEDTNPEVDEIVTDMLKNCVQHHSAIIKFVEDIESVFSFGLLTQFLSSIIVICNTGFYLLMISTGLLQFTSLAIYFVAMMTQLSLYCWYGNEMILKSMQIGEACYLSNWYTCRPKVKKLLFIMMERSKRPLFITAWKFSRVSLSAFSSIIQWSYSYFALLQRLAKDEDF